MEPISEQEKQRRRDTMASVLGTHAMEGMFPDEATQQIIQTYLAGGLTHDQFSQSLQDHAYALAGLRPALAGAA